MTVFNLDPDDGDPPTISVHDVTQVAVCRLLQRAAEATPEDGEGLVDVAMRLHAWLPDLAPKPAPPTPEPAPTPRARRTPSTSNTSTEGTNS